MESLGERPKPEAIWYEPTHIWIARYIPEIAEVDYFTNVMF